MSAWLGIGKCQTLSLKRKEPKVEPLPRQHQVEEAEQEKTTFQEQLYLAELPPLDALSQASIGHSKPGEPDVGFLTQDFAQFENFDEKDEAWDFKTLKNEIAHVVSRFYDGVKLPPFPSIT